MSNKLTYLHYFSTHRQRNCAITNTSLDKIYAKASCCNRDRLNMINDIT